jgi:hypothetical protein
MEARFPHLCFGEQPEPESHALRKALGPNKAIKIKIKAHIDRELFKPATPMHVSCVTSCDLWPFKIQRSCLQGSMWLPYLALSTSYLAISKIGFED